MGRKKGSKSGTTRVMTRSKPNVVEEDKDSDLDVMDQDFVGFEGSARKSAEEESESEVEEVLDLGGVDEDDSSSEDGGDESDGDQASSSSSGSSSDEDNNDGTGGKDGAGPVEDSSEDEDDEDSDDEDTDGNHLKKLLDSIAPDLKRRALGQTADSDDDDDESDDSDDEKPIKGKLGWGRKTDLYGADTTDLGVEGEKLDEAEEEEEAVERVLKQSRGRMTEADFEDSFVGSTVDADSSSGSKKSKKKSGGIQAVGSGAMGGLEGLVLGGKGGREEGMQVETLSRDLSKITQKKRLAMLKAESPELLMLVTELKERVKELKEKVNPLRTVLEESAEMKEVFSDDLVDYLEAKQQILLSYCINVVFYLALKSEGRSVKNHPVLKQLLELRYVMEKMRPLDSKLKYQLDRLIKFSTLSAEDRQAMKLRPNLSALRARGTGSDEDDDEDDGSSDGDSGEMNEGQDSGSEVASSDEEDAYVKRSRKGKQDDAQDAAVYRPPKMAAQPYHDEEAAEEKRVRKKDKLKAKLKGSEMLQALQEEFGDAPLAESSSGLTGLSREEREAQEAEDERRSFEEERFVRLVVSKKDKKAMKRAQKNAGKMDSLAGIGDVGEFEEVSKLVNQGRSAGASLDAMEAGFDDDDGGDDDNYEYADANNAAALERAMTAFTDDNGVRKKRRRAPEGPMDTSFGGGNDDDDGGGGGGDDDDDDDDDDDANLYEDFVDKKRAYKSKKKDHYSVSPTFGSDMAEEVADGKKRAASYEIIKNRGLTPHRKKANRNPRVKKKEQYRKAVINRKGAVRDVITGVGNSYAGEATGINKTIARSRKFSD